MDSSVIIPVYNEEKNISILMDKLMTSSGLVGNEWEVIFIDDGSTDGTFLELQRLKEKIPQIKIIPFGIKRGKQQRTAQVFNWLQVMSS